MWSFQVLRRWGVFMADRCLVDVMPGSTYVPVVLVGIEFPTVTGLVGMARGTGQSRFDLSCRLVARRWGPDAMR